MGPAHDTSGAPICSEISSTFAWGRRVPSINEEVVLESCRWRGYVPAGETYALGSLFTPRSYLAANLHTTCLRKLLNIKWQDWIPDTEVLAQEDLPSTYAILMQSQLCWAGHVARMPYHRLPKRLFYGELQQGKRSHEGQKKRFKDTLKHP